MVLLFKQDILLKIVLCVEQHLHKGPIKVISMTRQTVQNDTKLEDEFDEFDENISQDIIHILEQEALPIPEGTHMDSINQAIISQQEISLILAASVNSDDERSCDNK